MARNTYPAAFKAKIVLAVLSGEKELGAIAVEHNLNPNMVRQWKKDFVENAPMIFEDKAKEEKIAKRKEAALEKKNIIPQGEAVREIRMIGLLRLTAFSALCGGT